MAQQRKKPASHRAAASLRRRAARCVLFCSAAILLSFAAAGVVFNLPLVMPSVTAEAGGPLPALQDYLYQPSRTAAFAVDPARYVDMNVPGTYTVPIRADLREYIALLVVADTTPPQAQTVDTRIYTTQPLAPEDLVRDIADATAVTVGWGSPAPDMGVPGAQDVGVTLTDSGGNVTALSARVEVVLDDTPPTITGVQELTIKAGESVQYKSGVTVTDNDDPDVQLQVDNTGVDLNKVGDYTVVYYAVDAAGNRAEAPTALHVLEPGLEGATEDVVNAEADAVLAGILTEGMTQYEQAQAIFDWVYGEVKNVGEPPKTTWVEGAYRGLFQRRGDCWVYAMTSKVLLTRAGIPNLDIKMERPGRQHYWNLIDIGEGWHHFDANRWFTGWKGFYRTDGEVKQYSRTHGNSHEYIPEDYPEIV